MDSIKEPQKKYQQKNRKILQKISSKKKMS